MKLSTILFATAVNANYTPPKFRELMVSYKEASSGKDGERGNRGWGQPIVRGFVNHKKCPDLPVPEGATGIVCDQASCAVECKGGYIIEGNLRSKCKKQPKNGGFDWRRPLGKCKTCDSEPEFDDSKIWKACWIEPKNNRRVCTFGCKQGANLVGEKSAHCRCSRGKNKCSWYYGKNKLVKDWNVTKCVGGAPPPNDGEVTCASKPKKCTDVSENTSIYNSWTCRNCIRIRSEFSLPKTFDNRDHMVMEFTEPAQIQNFAHPMAAATNPSGDLKTWIITFSEEALFGDRRMDFTSEWRYFEQPAKLVQTHACPCSNKY